MAAEQQSGAEHSLTYSAFCERLSGVGGADLVYAADPCGRAALEILWLKLSLLVGVIRAAASPAFDLGVCRVTVDPTATHIPMGWNFRLSCDSPSASVRNSQFSTDFGQLWLSTLLANKQQDAARINAVVNEIVSACGADADRLAKSIFSSPTFGAQQLSSAEPTDTSSAVPAGLWCDVVLTGFKLVTGMPKFSYVAESGEFTATARARLLADSVALQTRAKQALFIDPPLIEKSLREVLLELIDDPHWLDALSTTPAVAAKPAPERAPLLPQVPVTEEENAEATIIIKRGAHSPAAQVRAPVPTPAPTAGSAVPSVSRPVASPPPEEPDNLEATIIIAKDKKR